MAMKKVEKKAPAPKSTKKPAKAVEVEETEIEDTGVDAGTEGQVPREELEALSEEMNIILFPDSDPVDFSEMDDEAMTEQLVTDAENIDPKDKFSDESKATLAAIGVEIEWSVAKHTKGDKKIAKAKAKADKPAKKAGEKKSPPKFVVNEFGHRVGTMSAAIDDMVKKGTTMEKAVSTLCKDFGREERLAKNKFNAHIKHLKDVKKLDIVHDEKKDIYKLA